MLLKILLELKKKIKLYQTKIKPRKINDKIIGNF